MGRSWQAAAGDAVLLSVRLEPKIGARRLPLVSLAAGVALSKVAGQGFGLKWPNDLLDGAGRKVAGVLCEAEIAGDRVAWVVVGVGLNVHGAPAIEGAGHLADTRTRAELAVRLVSAIRAQVARVATDPASLLDDWRRMSVTLGAEVRVAGMAGTAVDLAPDGGLVLELADGRRHIVRAGDVEMISIGEEHP